MPLNHAEEAAKPTTPLRSLETKMAWPRRKRTSQSECGSTAAKGITTATVGLIRRASKLLPIAKSEVVAGRAELTYHRVDLSQPGKITFFDASLAQEEEGKAQYAVYTVATDTRIVEQTVKANQVEHAMNCIPRLIVEGILVTNTRSLYDHIHATGSLLRMVPYTRATGGPTDEADDENHYLETGRLSTTQSTETQAQEQHLARLRKEQRRKPKMKAAKMANTNVLYVIRKTPDWGGFL